MAGRRTYASRVGGPGAGITLPTCVRAVRCHGSRRCSRSHPALAQQVYKSVDAQGNVVYSDRGSTKNAPTTSVHVTEPDPAEVAQARQAAAAPERRRAAAPEGGSPRQQEQGRSRSAPTGGVREGARQVLPGQGHAPSLPARCRGQSRLLQRRRSRCAARAGAPRDGFQLRKLRRGPPAMQAVHRALRILAPLTAAALLLGAPGASPSAQSAVKYRDAEGHWIFTDQATSVVAAAGEPISMSHEAAALHITVTRQETPALTRLVATNGCLCSITVRASVAESNLGGRTGGIGLRAHAGAGGDAHPAAGVRGERTANPALPLDRRARFTAGGASAAAPLPRALCAGCELHGVAGFPGARDPHDAGQPLRRGHRAA